MIVKAGDTHAVQWKANMNLTGATVRLVAKPRKTSIPVVLESSVADPAEGVVSHTLTGTLPVDTYQVELEVTVGGEIITFPNNTYASLTVIPDLD